MTQWRPDTCDCIVDYDGDIKVTAVVKKCAKHSDTLNDAHHLETVLAHNRKKNYVHNAAVEHAKSIGIDHESIHTAYDPQDNLIVISKLDVDAQKKVTNAVESLLGASAIKFRG